VDGSQCRRDVQTNAAETGGLDADAAADEPQQRLAAELGHAEVIDGEARKSGQPGLQLRELTGVEVELDVPANEVLHAVRESLELVEGFPTAAIEVDAHAADAGGVQGLQLGVGGIGMEVGDADEVGAELGQGGA